VNGVSIRRAYSAHAANDAPGVNPLASTFYPTFMRSTGVSWALGVARIGSIAGPAVGGILIALRHLHRAHELPGQRAGTSQFVW